MIKTQAEYLQQHKKATVSFLKSIAKGDFTVINSLTHGLCFNLKHVSTCYHPNIGVYDNTVLHFEDSDRMSNNIAYEFVNVCSVGWHYHTDRIAHPVPLKVKVLAGKPNLYSLLLLEKDNNGMSQGEYRISLAKHMLTKVDDFFSTILDKAQLV